jgi:fructokinase
VKVADTIGSGDAFTAMLTHMLLRNSGIDEANEMANRMGAWIATQVGATPKLGDTSLNEVLSRIEVN